MISEQRTITNKQQYRTRKRNNEINNLKTKTIKPSYLRPNELSVKKILFKALRNEIVVTIAWLY